MAKKQRGFDFDGETWAHLMAEIIPPEMLSMKARLALLILARHCKPHHQCFVGLHRLASMMGASKNTAREALKELECLPLTGGPGNGKRLITRTERPGTSPVFFLHVWEGEQDAPPLLDNGKIDDYAPTAPQKWIDRAEEEGEQFPFQCYLKSDEGKEWKAEYAELLQKHVAKHRTWKKQQKNPSVAVVKDHPVMDKEAMKKAGMTEEDIAAFMAP